MRRRIAQDPLQHPSKRVERPHLVADMVGRHGRSCRILKTAGGAGHPTRRFPMLLSRQAEISRAAGVKLRQRGRREGKEGKDKWRLLLPGASEPRLTELNPSGLQEGLSDCVTPPEQPEHSCHWQLWIWPDNAGTIPGKSAPFTPSSILFRPRKWRTEDFICRLSSGTGGVAGYRPRVRKVYYDARLSP